LVPLGTLLLRAEGHKWADDSRGQIPNPYFYDL
jgi:hypothetical protein